MSCITVIHHDDRDTIELVAICQEGSMHEREMFRQLQEKFEEHPDFVAVECERTEFYGFIEEKHTLKRIKVMLQEKIRDLESEIRHKQALLKKM